MIHFLKVYFTILPIMAIIDFLWLGVLMSDFYKTEMGSLARKSGSSLDPIIWPAILIYIIMPLGILFFVLPKISTDNALLTSLGWGFIYGVFLFGIYDLTNLSLLNNWSFKMSMIDMAWGGTINAIMSYIAFNFNKFYS